MTWQVDPTRAEVRVEFALAEAEHAQQSLWRASAVLFRSIDETLREAEDHPGVFVPAGSPGQPDPGGTGEGN